MRRAVVMWLVVAVTVFAGAASAEWLWGQGNVAQIQDTSLCTATYFGWGLDLNHNSGVYNWIHMPIPSKAGGTLGAQYFKIRFYTGSVDAWIAQVDVWNGDTMVSQFKNLSYSNGWKTIQFNMGSKKTFDKGMSLSIKTAAGVEPMSHRFIFSGAGANFQ